MMRQYLLTAKALADESRIRILKLLENGELCVCQIIAVIGLSQSTVSKHLAILKSAGLVEDRKKTIWVYYRLADEEVSPYGTSFLKHLRESVNDDRKIISDRERLKKITLMDLKAVCRSLKKS
jgi:DNA-binding transcriptional ArsR family regulator